MQYVEAPESYNLIGQVRSTVPAIAQRTLQLYANNRVKELKLTTKAYKYDYPFHDTYLGRVSLQKLIKLIDKVMKKEIPYLESRVVTGHEVVRSYTYLNFKVDRVTKRYLRYICHLANKFELPLRLQARDDRYWNGREYKEKVYLYVSMKNTTEGPYTGTILLYYLPQLLKFARTSSRLFLYDPNRTLR